MTTVIPTQPFGRASYASDRAVTWAEDVAYCLHALEPTTPDSIPSSPDADTVKIYTNTARSRLSFHPDVYRVVVGPLIAVIALHRVKLHAILQTFIEAEGFGALLVGGTCGTVSVSSEPLQAQFAYRPYFGGNVTLGTVTRGTAVYLHLKWDFDHLLKTYAGESDVAVLDWQPKGTGGGGARVKL